MDARAERFCLLLLLTPQPFSVTWMVLMISIPREVLKIISQYSITVKKQEKISYFEQSTRPCASYPRQVALPFRFAPISVI